MTRRTAEQMPRTDLTAATARTVGTGLALVLPVAALIVLRLFPPLVLDPSGGSGWLVPIGLAAVGLGAALATIPLLGALVSGGRLAAGAQGTATAALTAGTAALALAGPEAAVAFPDSGMGLILLTVAALLGAAVVASGRHLAAERSRWFGVIGALVLAETALAAALLGPGSALDPAVFWILALAGLVAGAAAGGWAYRRARLPALGAAALAVAALVFASSRPGTVDGLVGLAPLAIVPVLLVAALERRRRGDGGAAVGATVEADQPSDAGGEGDTGEAAERDRLGRELRSALAELTDARHTIALQRSELERAADIDPLTGVASRAAIMDRLRDEVAAARRYPHPVSIVLIDVDRMGDLNARLGTAAGDAVLRELALRMRVRVREADAIGRVAGDAFLAVLPHTDERGATVFAQAVRDRSTHRPIATGRGQVAVTVSIGLTTMRPDEELTADGLLARADEAVASARAGGGNVIAFDRLHGLARLEERHDPYP